VIFGKGPVAIEAAQLLIAEGYDLRFAVPSSTELPDQPSLGSWAVENGIDVRRPSRLDALDLDHADLGVSAFFDRIFRQRHIDAFEMLVNVHNSPLPRYRGVRPINWALKNGETVHGVTLHIITPGIDEGPVLDQELYPIDPEEDEVRDVYGRGLDAATRLLRRAIPSIWDLPHVDQVEADATYYSAADDDRLGDRRYWTRADASLD